MTPESHSSEIKNKPEIVNSPEIAIKEGSLVLLIGLPGSGKTTFANQHFPQEAIVSTDALREELTNNPANQLVSEQAFSLAKDIVKSRLKNNQITVVDAMNLSEDLRTKFAQIAKEQRKEVIGILLDPPIEESLKRDQQRLKEVGEIFIKQKAQTYNLDMRPGCFEDQQMGSIYSSPWKPTRCHVAFPGQRVFQKSWYKARAYYPECRRSANVLTQCTSRTKD